MDFLTSVSLDIEVLRSHRNNSGFEYHSESKVAIGDNNYHVNT